MGGQVQPIHYDPASVNKLTKEVCIMGLPLNLTVRPDYLFTNIILIDRNRFMYRCSSRGSN